MTLSTTQELNLEAQYWRVGCKKQRKTLNWDLKLEKRLLGKANAAGNVIPRASNSRLSWPVNVTGITGRISTGDTITNQPGGSLRVASQVRPSRVRNTRHHEEGTGWIPLEPEGEWAIGWERQWLQQQVPLLFHHSAALIRTVGGRGALNSHNPGLAAILH